MNKSKEKILIKKEKLTLSYLIIITSIFGVFFYTFVTDDRSSLLVSIIFLISGVSLTILHLKGKLIRLKKSQDKNRSWGASILGYILGVLQLLAFIVNPHRNAFYLIFSLIWFEIALFYTLLYVKLREFSDDKQIN